MAVTLTQEQEHRILAVVKRGAYASIEEALDAAVGAVENVSDASFDGGGEELRALLHQGLASAELDEGEFWSSVEQATRTS